MAAVACSNGKLYELKVTVVKSGNANLSSSDSVILMHRRLGHLNFADIRKMKLNDMADGLLDMPTKTVDELCEPCIFCKQTSKPFRTTSGNRSFRPLERIHSGVVGPMLPMSYNQKRYVVTFIDDFTHFAKVYLMKSKSEVFGFFKDFVSQSTDMFNSKISRLRCDNGGEYSSNEFKDFCKEFGIQIEYTQTYSPQQNGVSKRFNRILIERARTLLIDSNLDNKFWSEAILTSAYLINRSATSAFKSEDRLKKTPAELWYSKRPNLSNLKIFGCIGFKQIPKQHRSKSNRKSNKCIMMGYAPNGYRLWDIDKNAIVVSRDVIFDEKKMYCTSKTESSNFFLFDDELDVTENTTRAVVIPPENGSFEFIATNEIEQANVIAVEHLGSENPSEQVNSVSNELLDSTTLNSGQESDEHDENGVDSEVEDLFGTPQTENQNIIRRCEGIRNAEHFVDDDDTPDALEGARERNDWCMWKEAVHLDTSRITNR